MPRPAGTGRGYGTTFRPVRYLIAPRTGSPRCSPATSPNCPWSRTCRPCSSGVADTTSTAASASSQPNDVVLHRGQGLESREAASEEVRRSLDNPGLRHVRAEHGDAHPQANAAPTERTHVLRDQVPHVGVGQSSVARDERLRRAVPGKRLDDKVAQGRTGRGRRCRRGALDGDGGSHPCSVGTCTIGLPPMFRHELRLPRQPLTHGRCGRTEPTSDSGRVSDRPAR